jgi:phosphoserine phosphatase RsbU/P
VRADGSILTLVSTGLPLGLMDDRMPYGDATHTLEAGDTVVLYSDGVTDAQNTDGEEYGEARLHDLLQSLVQDRPDAIADGVLASVDAFVKGAPQFDDMTILVLRRA